VLLQEPPRSEGDLNFWLFRVPVRVHPMFWLLTLILGLGYREPMALLTWVVAAFLSILVHEMGHAAVTRLFGFYPFVVLHGMGGLTLRGPGVLGTRNPGPAGEIAISAAGSGAQFALAAAVYYLLKTAGYEVAVVTGFPYVALPVLIDRDVPVGFAVLVNQLFLVSVFWGLLNLLPIYPLDGGQISREFLQRVMPREGLRLSLMISAFAATFFAVYAAVEWRSVLTALFFGYLGFASLQALTMFRRGPW
jgi:stage IV sporulation protein FB